MKWSEVKWREHSTEVAFVRSTHPSRARFSHQIAGKAMYLSLRTCRPCSVTLWVRVKKRIRGEGLNQTTRPLKEQVKNWLPFLFWWSAGSQLSSPSWPTSWKQGLTFERLCQRWRSWRTARCRPERGWAGSLEPDVEKRVRRKPLRCWAGLSPEAIGCCPARSPLKEGWIWLRQGHIIRWKHLSQTKAGVLSY